VSVNADEALDIDDAMVKAVELGDVVSHVVS
jgi:hypothetical protein